MAPLLIFKDSFVNALRTSIDVNLRRYVQDETWADSVGTTSQRILKTNVDLSANISLQLPQVDDLKDFDNAVLLHRTLNMLTPLQARDPRLWTRLSHVECWQYMRKRWPIERYLKGSDGMGVGRVAERYFVPTVQSRALLRNGVARLWWIAQLSFDPARENPYELTQILLANLDITQSILERAFGRSQSVAHGFLEFLQFRKDELLVGGDLNRDRIRALSKFLNVYGGYCVLDVLTKDEIRALLDKEFLSIRA